MMKPDELTCEHWSECGIKNGGCCKINKFGKTISFGVCLDICKNNTEDKKVQNKRQTLRRTVSKKIQNEMELVNGLFEKILNSKEEDRAEIHHELDNKMNEIATIPSVLVVNRFSISEDDIFLYNSTQFAYHNGSYYCDTESEAWQSASKTGSISSVKKITWDKFKSVVSAIVSGEHIPKEQQLKRLKICHSCELFRWDKIVEEGHCGVCGCKLGGNSRLTSLTTYKETDEYGCKHPNGSKWKKQNV